MVYARQEAAKAWCGSKVAFTTMDPVLAEEFAMILVHHMYEPHLGMVTNDEILEEIRARIEVHADEAPQLIEDLKAIIAKV